LGERLGVLDHGAMLEGFSRAVSRTGTRRPRDPCCSSARYARDSRCSYAREGEVPQATKLLARSSIWLGIGLLALAGLTALLFLAALLVHPHDEALATHARDLRT